MPKKKRNAEQAQEVQAPENTSAAEVNAAPQAEEITVQEVSEPTSPVAQEAATPKPASRKKAAGTKKKSAKADFFIFFCHIIKLVTVFCKRAFGVYNKCHFIIFFFKE